MDLWEQLAQGRCHRLRIDRRPHHFGQEGMKDHMIFVVKKNDLTSVVGQLLAQTLGTFCPSKPAPHNNDACLSHTITLHPCCRHRQDKCDGQYWALSMRCPAMARQREDNFLPFSKTAFPTSSRTRARAARSSR